MKLLAIIQPTHKGLARRYSAYSPDIPGCIADGETEEKALEALKATVRRQIENLQKLGLDLPKQYCQVKMLEIDSREKRKDQGYAACLTGLS